MKLTILGGGSWGSALGVHLAKNNHQIKIWEFVAEQAKEMQEKRICRLLPDAPLHQNIFVSSSMEEILPETEILFVVVPSDKVESTLEKAQSLVKPKIIVICSKGFGSNLKLLNKIAEEKFPKADIYCLYGPTHAEEVCKGMFSGIVLAGGSKKKILQKMIASKDLKVELSKDIIGVQVCAALKNILAIFVGLVDGMGLGDNAKAYVMTKGLEEIKQVGLKMGAKKETFYGLAGIGDMIVTCTSKHSRNHYVGEQVGKGRKLDEVLSEMKMVAEGITTLQQAVHLSGKYKLKLPLINGLYEVLYKGKDPKKVLEEM